MLSIEVPMEVDTYEWRHSLEGGSLAVWW